VGEHHPPTGPPAPSDLTGLDYVTGLTTNASKIPSAFSTGGFRDGETLIWS